MEATLTHGNGISIGVPAECFRRQCHGLYARSRLGRARNLYTTDPLMPSLRTCKLPLAGGLSVEAVRIIHTTKTRRAESFVRPVLGRVSASPLRFLSHTGRVDRNRQVSRGHRRRWADLGLYNRRALGRTRGYRYYKDNTCPRQTLQTAELAANALLLFDLSLGGPFGFPSFFPRLSASAVAKAVDAGLRTDQHNPSLFGKNKNTKKKKKNGETCVSHHKPKTHATVA